MLVEWAPPTDCGKRFATENTKDREGIVNHETRERHEKADRLKLRTERSIASVFGNEGGESSERDPRPQLTPAEKKENSLKKTKRNTGADKVVPFTLALPVHALDI